MRMNGETTLSTIPRPDRPARAKRGNNGHGVDWEAAHKKATESDTRMGWVDEIPEDLLEEAWAKRAIQLALSIEEGDTGEQLEVTVIRLGREVYGIEADYVYDIRKLESITRVPRVPDWVAGVVNLRGRIVSVLDLQRFLDIPLSERKNEGESASRHLVVVETANMEIALLVDEVLSIEAMPVNQMQDVGSSGHKVRTDYVRGIFVREADNPTTDKNGGLVLLLDLKRLLADKRLNIHDELN